MSDDSKARSRDTFGNHDGGPHVRYVQEYATDSDPFQPVSVVLLTWDGSAWISYGSDFRIGDASTPSIIGSGQKFWIIWRREAQRWFVLSSAGTETLRLVRGKAKGTVTADDTTFVIDNIIVLGGGLDPRSSPGDMAEELDVANIHREAFADNEDVTCIYSPDVVTDVDWELLVVERYRLIRGQAVGAVDTGDSTFTIDNVITLADGLDPRTDPTDTAETVSINNVHADAYADNGKVVAAYNNGEWEALPTSTSSTTLRRARVYSTITAASGNLTADWGDGQVKFMDDATGVLDADPTDVDNQWDYEFVTDAMVSINTGFDPPRVENGTCEAFVSWTEPE
jgi:hypothetical protein